MALADQLTERRANVVLARLAPQPEMAEGLGVVHPRPVRNSGRAAFERQLHLKGPGSADGDER